MTVLASLAFVLAASVAIGAMLGTILRYRESLLADLAGYRDLTADRDFHFRVFEFGRQPGTIYTNNVRPFGKRNLAQRSITCADWRAAA